MFSLSKDTFDRVSKPADLNPIFESSLTAYRFEFSGVIDEKYGGADAVFLGELREKFLRDRD